MTHATLSADELAIRLDERRGLRVLDEADAQELHAVIEANRAHLARWMPWAAEQNLGGTLAFIRRVRQQLAENNGFSVAIVVERRIAGTLGFHRLDWDNRSTSAGYWIAEAEQGQGTVTIAVRALLDRAFDTWGLNRVEIRAAIENHRSRAIPARLGFREEGVLRQAERFAGRYVDHVLYALLAADPRLPTKGHG
jgi:ribosomal-protein-serine acetyltransferase